MVTKVGGKYYYDDPERGLVETTERHYKEILAWKACEPKTDNHRLGRVAVFGTGGNTSIDEKELWELFKDPELYGKSKS